MMEDCPLHVAGMIECPPPPPTWRPSRPAGPCHWLGKVPARAPRGRGTAPTSIFPTFNFSVGECVPVRGAVSQSPRVYLLAQAQLAPSRVQTMYNTLQRTRDMNGLVTQYLSHYVPQWVQWVSSGRVRWTVAN